MTEWIVACSPFWFVFIVSLLLIRRLNSLAVVILAVIITWLTLFIAPSLMLNQLMDREASAEAEERYGVEFVLEDSLDSTKLPEDITPEERKHSRLSFMFFFLEEDEFMTVDYITGEYEEESGVVVKRGGEFVLLDSNGREYETAADELRGKQ